MNQLHPIAQAVQSQGRGNDTQLVHMTPNEVQGLQALAKAHGGSLSINPSTGLPEAGFLESLLPTILGAGLAAATGGSSLMIGAGLGALQYARTGSLEKGLLAGLGAYGGAGLGASLAGAGATAGSDAMKQLAAEQAKKQAEAAAAKTVAEREAAQQLAKKAGEELALQQANVLGANTFGQNVSNMGAGLKTAFNSPTTFMQQFGGSGMDLAQAAGAAVAPTLLQQPKTVTPPSDNEQYQYTYNPNRASEEDLAAQRAANPFGELKYFNPQYQGPRMVRVAQGGELKYADGGIADGYEYDPVTQTYKKKTSAPIGAVPAVGVPGSGGDSSMADTPLSKQTIDFLEKEAKTPGARDARMGKINEILSMLAPGALAAKAFQTVTGATPTDRPVPVETRSVSQTPGGDTGSYQDYGDMSQRELAESGGGVGAAKGGVLRYENGGPIGAVEPIGIRGNRPMDADYFLDMAKNAVVNTGVKRGLMALGAPKAVASALGPIGLGLYGMYRLASPDTPSAPGGDSGGTPGGDSGPTITQYAEDPAQTAANQAAAEAGGYPTLAQGGLAGLSAGGMAKGGFVVPADVVSALGNGSTDAGLRTLQAKMGAVKPIKGQGDGLSDSIKTSIDGKQPARVADGEAYIPPETVAKIGGGDPKKGAKKLYAMMDRIRQQAHGKTSQQRKVNAKAVV